MGLLKQLKEAALWIFNDLKGDFLFIINLVKGNTEIKIKKEILKKITIVSILKECWVWYLLIFAAFFAGMFIQSIDLGEQCNNYIQEELVPEINKVCLSDNSYKDILYVPDSILNFSG